MSGTPAACTVLAAELQCLRARHELSLAALAERTPFSKSSWGRYLNGKALPPWQAVQHLCTLVDEPEERFRALWTVAEAAWNKRDAVSIAAPQKQAPPAPSAQPARPDPAAPVAPEVPPAAADHPAQRRMGRGALLVLLGTFVLLAGLGVAVWKAMAAHPAPVAAATSASAQLVGCVGRACDGGDPTAMNCGVDPQSLGVHQLPHGAEIEIRYSATCRSAWARVWSSQVGDRLFIGVGSDVRSSVVPDPYTAQTFFFTPMVPVDGGGPALRACLTFPDKQSQCVSAREP